MRKRKRSIKWGRVLSVIVFLMIIVGGMVMYRTFYLKDKDDNTSKENKNTYTNEGETTGGEDVNSSNKANADLEKAPSNYSDFLTLEDGKYLTEKGYTLVIENGIASIDGHLIVNKTYSVPESYQPKNPEEAVTGERCNNCLEKEVMSAFQLLKSDATSLGLNIYIASGYRAYSYQDKLYNNYSAVSGMEKADTYSARPGHSEHQTGLCFDLNSVEDSFANTDEGRWVNENAYLYGFIIRYPKGGEQITGYQYESWHLRYVGKELAEKLYNQGDWITIEEYYGISSSYS